MALAAYEMSSMGKFGPFQWLANSVKFQRRIRCLMTLPPFAQKKHT